MKYFVYTVIGIVTVAVVAGFFIVGSPQEERLRRFDERRVSDLRYLQSEILNYWINKSRLPADLSLLRDDIRGVRAPIDPETGDSYGYAVKAPETFELCATFALPSFGKEAAGELRVVRPGGFYGLGNWEHKAGLVCFERVIDKELYKQVQVLVPEPPEKF